MSLQVQYATENPAEFVDLNVADWARAPKKESPARALRAVDSRAGYINELVSCGVRFTGDVYAVEDMADGSGGHRITVINDDPQSGWSAATRYARVVNILPLARDHRLGGAYNTRLSQTVYSDDPRFRAMPVGNTVVQPWKAFRYPPEHLRRYGAQLPDRLYTSHVLKQNARSWRSFTKGVPSHELVSGEVRDQRAAGQYLRPFGTRTFYQTDTSLASGVHSAGVELALASTASGSPVTVSSTNIGTGGELAFLFTSPAGIPNEGTWPTGVVRIQLDVPDANVDLQFGLRTIGLGLGHFARVGTLLLLDSETKPQIEPAFALSGIFLATTGSVSWIPGLASDRIEAAIAAQRTQGHGVASFSLRVNTFDSFLDGPWTSITPSGGDAALMMAAGL